MKHVETPHPGEFIWSEIPPEKPEYNEHELLATYSLLAHLSKQYPIDSPQWAYLTKAMAHFRGILHGDRW
jgi:hypothetical protein